MIQLEGALTLNGTDYSDEIVMFEINEQRITTRKRATFGNASRSEKAGDYQATITIEFIRDVVSAALAQELRTALLTDSAELTWSARFTDAAVGADNPEYSGSLVVTEVGFGGVVGEENTSRVTFPITAAGITVTTV